MAKSYVTIAKLVCPVCGAKSDSNEVLLHKQFREVFDDADPPVTGYGLCPTHQAQVVNGYLFLIEADPKRSSLSADGRRCQLHDAYRTGRIVTIKRETYNQIFNLDINGHDFVFIDPDAVEQLINQYARCTGEKLGDEITI